MVSRSVRAGRSLYLDLYPTPSRQSLWRPLSTYSREVEPADMILCHLLLLVLSFYSVAVLGSDGDDYDGTRIANRTIERVRRLFSFCMKRAQHITNTTRRLFDCRRTRYFLPTLIKTFKIG